jgi:hypothetical protein
MDSWTLKVFLHISIYINFWTLKPVSDDMRVFDLDRSMFFNKKIFTLCYQASKINLIEEDSSDK